MKKNPPALAAYTGSMRRVSAPNMKKIAPSVNMTVIEMTYSIAIRLWSFVRSHDFSVRPLFR